MTDDITGPTRTATPSADCLKEVEAAGIDIAKYNTIENAKDVRTITRALGYETYNLYGISYGTKLALETMRVAPEGIRSVVIDGVAPPWVHLYETLALKMSEPDRACGRAMQGRRHLQHDLSAARHGHHRYAEEGEGRQDHPPGQAGDDGTIFRPFDERNGKYGNLSMTPYIPAFIYELNRGKEMPTVDMLVGRDFVMPMPGDDDVSAASVLLPKRQRDLIVGTGRQRGHCTAG